MELPAPPFYRRWSVILAGVIGLAAIVAMVGWRGLQEVATPETTVPSSPPTTAVPGAVTTTTTPPTSYGPTSKPADQLWRGEGTGGELSPGITAPARWRIQWAFDCASFEKYDGGNFKITGDGVFEQVDIQDVATQGTGTRRFTRRGFGHLRVETVCDHWTVTVLAD
jgi:hypothetical protein